MKANERSGGEIIAHCRICGRPICYGDRDVHIVDGMEDMPVCDACWNWKKLTPGDLFELFFKDVYVVSGKRYAEEY